MACVMSQMFVFGGERWGHTCPVATTFAMPPPWDEETDVWRGHTNTLELSKHIQPSPNGTLSSPFHLSSSSLSLRHILITPQLHYSSRTAHSLRLHFTDFSLLASPTGLNTHINAAFFFLFVADRKHWPWYCVGSYDNGMDTHSLCTCWFQWNA